MGILVPECSAEVLKFISKRMDEQKEAESRDFWPDTAQEEVTLPVLEAGLGVTIQNSGEPTVRMAECGSSHNHFIGIDSRVLTTGQGFGTRDSKGNGGI